MNYRHSFHAGNVADVFKHYVLTEILAALADKPAPFCVIDSHAGGGRYRLESPGEFAAGIGQIWPERGNWPALARYFEVIAAESPSLQVYPGSPLFIRAGLRPGDRAVLLELHPEEYETLRLVCGGDRRIAVHHADAWRHLKAFVPPPENRGLVLIDPPFERRDEFSQILAFLAHAHKHWRNGLYMIWYPIKAYAPVATFLARVAALGLTGHVVELLTLPLDHEQRLNGSGLVLINMPWKLPDTLRAVLPPLAARLAGDTGRPEVRIRELRTTPA